MAIAGIDYCGVAEDVEREHIRLAVDILTRAHRLAAGRMDDWAAGPEYARGSWSRRV